jgi:hypothetical protein
LLLINLANTIPLTQFLFASIKQTSVEGKVLIPRYGLLIGFAFSIVFSSNAVAFDLGGMLDEVNKGLKQLEQGNNQQQQQQIQPTQNQSITPNTKADKDLEFAISYAKNQGNTAGLINVIKNHPNTPQAAEAQKLIEQYENARRTKEFHSAIKSNYKFNIEQFIRKYPGSKEALEAQKILDQNEKERISKEFSLAMESKNSRNLEQLINKYPESKEAIEAKKFLSQLKVKRRDEERAKDLDYAIRTKDSKLLEQIIKEYPETPEGKEAYIKLAEMEINGMDWDFEKAKDMGGMTLENFLKGPEWIKTKEGKAYHKKITDHYINEQKEANLKESEEAFIKAKEGGRIWDLKQFYEKYPDSPRANEAKEIFATYEKKKAAEQKQKDEAAERSRQLWQSVKAANSVASIDQYLKENPNSRYRDEAKQAKSQIIYNHVKTSECENEILNLSDFIKSNPHAIVGKCISFTFLESIQFLDKQSGLFSLYKRRDHTKQLGFIEFKKPVNKKWLKGITKLVGMHTYETRIGSTNTVPHLIMLKIID